MAAARRVPVGPAPDPAVQKLRVRYAKRGRMRFTSSRDFQRALERALRLAQVPMAYSAGFHPHPKVSYANAAPTGVASEAEYAELSVTRVIDADQLVQSLDAALPDGLDIVDAVEAAPGALADLLVASRWQLSFPGLSVEHVQQAVDAFLVQESVEVTRMMKQGPRAIDVRPPVLLAEVVAGGDTHGPAAVLLVTIRHTTPTVRPAEIWTALRGVSEVDLPRPASTRLAQGRLGEDGTLLDPLR
ncbi:TIGR03936 family radical SAM-associated protein [Ornithinimicrobium cryptoxanthini]|uniref:TIGR03936 family radical SAM-associated protein n=1 Tax=Ornithinimicrobium cryptoxanthini TaxID=2934161 RepID=A0ABY4YEW3_9MICO|nr:TIGR03936 family radical SAM-associated protein [Ornithinimicrobium cryptoxanthini]USQ75137.1 TIGR03936 family radical SAM-associated protein [Ornithinimicrobium cryptoxanthini]